MTSTTPAHPYQLVIFDFDGTLADSANWMIETFNGIAGQFGLRRVARDEVQMLRGRSTADIVRYLGVPVWKVPLIATEMRKRASADVDRIHVFAGVSETLRALDERGKKLAIVSSNSEENVRRVLGPENAARIDCFDCSAAMFGKARKLRSVMRTLGAQAQETIYIGDETRDIEAARDTHVASGAVTWGYAKAEILAHFAPTLMFDSLSDIVTKIS